MYKYIMSRKPNERGLIGIGLCIIVFIIGYIILNYISSMEDPPLGNTIYILIGSTLTFTPFLGIVLILRYMYKRKKKKEKSLRRRKKHRLSYLKDDNKI